jgi:hypothetical protein
MRWFNFIFKNTELPLWLRRLNYISLAGVVAWPLIAFTSLFLFDDPNVEFQRQLTYFILMNLYPVFLFLISFLSFKAYRLSPLVAALLPSIPILAYAIVGVLIVIDI